MLLDGVTRKELAMFVRFGKLKNYRNAQKMLKDAGYDVKTSEGELLKKTFVDDILAVSIARWGTSWIFRYNPKFFSEEVGNEVTR
jgi:hypothetical protein